jgi:hypothetical protein
MDSPILAYSGILLCAICAALKSRTALADGPSISDTVGRARRIDLGGEPEQAATDRKGRVYVDVRDKNDIAVIDAKALTVAARYSVPPKGGVPDWRSMLRTRFCSRAAGRRR